MKPSVFNHRLVVWGGMMLCLLLAGETRAVPTQLYFRLDGVDDNPRLEKAAPVNGVQAEQTIPDGRGLACNGSNYPDISIVSPVDIRTFTYVTPEAWSKDPDLDQINFEFWASLKAGEPDFSQMTIRVTIKDALDDATWIEQMGATCLGCSGSACASPPASSTACNLNSASCRTKFNREAGGIISPGAETGGTMGSLRPTIALGSLITVEVWNVAGSGDGVLFSDTTTASWIKVPYAKDNFSIWGTVSPPHIPVTVESTITYVLDNTHIAGPTINSLDIEIPGGLAGGEYFQNVDRITSTLSITGYTVTPATSASDGTLSLDYSANPIIQGSVVTITFTTTAPGTSIKSIKWDATANPGADNFTISEKNPDGLFLAVLDDPPAAATLNSVTAANVTGGGGQIQIIWDGPDPDQFGITAYRVFRGPTAEGAMSLVATVPPDASPVTGPSSWKPATTLVTQSINVSYTDTTVTDGTLYCYTIKSVNPVGESVASLGLCATAYSAPGTPFTLTALVRDQAVELAWSPAGSGTFALTGYEIFRSTCATCSPLTLYMALWDTVPPTYSGTSFIDEPLANAALYSYQVRGFDVQGNRGAFSPMRTAQPAVNPPTGLVPNYDETLSGVTVQWQPSSNNVYALAGYNVYRSTCAGCPSTLLSGPTPTVAGGGTTLYTDTGIATSKLYYYAVSAVSVEGGVTVGASTATVEILTPPLTPAALTVLPYANLLLGWADSNAPGDVSWYKIYRSTYPETSPADFLDFAPPFSQSTTWFVDASLAVGQRYHYRVSAYYEVGVGAGKLVIDSVLTSTVYGLAKPGVPTGLTGQPANGMVVLSWTDLGLSQEVDLYRIYRSTISMSGGFIEVGVVSVTYYDDTGLTNGQTYYHRVTADNWGGEGPYAATLGVAPYDPPGPPGTLAAISRPQQILLNWGLSTPTAYPIDGYEVRRSVTSGAETLLVYLSSDSASVYLDTSFAAGDNGTTFFYIVRARDTLGGVSLPSNEASTAPAIPPCPSSMLTAAAAAATVELQWDIVDGALCAVAATFPVSSYRVYRSTTPGAGYQSIALSINFDATTYIDSAVTPGITYYYAIRTRDNATPPNESVEFTSPFDPVYSMEAYATPRIPAAAPGFLTILGEPYPHHERLTVSWIASVPATLAVVGYNVYRSVTVGGLETLTYISGGTATVYLDAPLAADQYYYYRVQPVEENGFLGYWAATSGTAIVISADGHTESATIPPSAPTITQLTASFERVDLCWDPPSALGTSPLGTYVLYRSSAGVPQSVMAPLPATTTCFSDATGLSNGVLWSYQVRAFDTKGEAGPWSNTVSGVPYQDPDMPTSPAAQVGNAQLTISWTAPVPTTFPLAGYNVYRGLVSNGEGAMPVNAPLIADPTVAFTDIGLVNGTQYFYKIETWDLAGHKSVLSAEVSGIPFAPPGTPSGLAVLPGNTLVMLDWAAPAAGTYVLSGYAILRSSCPANSCSTTLYIWDITTLTLPDAPVSNTLYTYQIRSFDAKGNLSAGSILVSTTSLDTIVNPPQTVATTVGVGSITLMWGGVVAGVAPGGPVTEFVILRGDCTTCPLTTSFYVSSSASMFIDTTIMNGDTATYRYVVRSVAASATMMSADYPGRNMVVVGNTCLPPAAPGSLAAEAGSGAVGLTWDAAASTCTLTAYYVYRSDDGGATYTQIPVPVGVLFPYEDLGLINGTLYQYYVTAVSAAGEGPPSNIVTATPAIRPNTFYLSHNVFAPLRGDRLDIPYTLEQDADVVIGVYTVAGMLVYEHRQNNVPAGPALGTYNMPSADGFPGWDGKARDGQYVASGVYLVRLQAGKFKKLLKVIVLK